MSKNIKKIITLTLAISAFSVISAITPGTIFDMTTKMVYAASYSPDDGELKSLTVKSTNGDALDLRDSYNGSTVKLSEDKEYYVKLTDDSDGIKINSKVEGTDYIVKIFASDKADATPYESGDEILLEKGNTTLYVRTYESQAAFRKSQKTLHDVSICEESYTVNVKKTTASSYEDGTQDAIYLDNLEISKGSISFTKGKTTYDDIKVDSDVDHIKITAEPQDSNDRVRINGSVVDSGDKYKKTIDLKNGKNEIKIKVTDNKDNQRTYTLNITRGNSSSSDNEDEVYLDDLKLSEGDIDFSKEENSYKVDLDESVSKITITAKPEDEEYLVTVNDKELNSDDDYEKKVSLSKGENTVKVVVNDEVNDKKRTYTLTINRGSAQDTDETDTKDNKTETDTKDSKTETKDNKTETGWIETTDGLKYKDENGKLLENSWLYDKGKGVYYYLNENGIKKTGWIQDKESWYLLDKEGVMLKGWQDVNGKRYFLDTSGAMKTGWYKEITTQNNTSTVNWYYLSDDGSMKTGWLKIEEKWYFLNTNGIMQNGWLINSNSKYYLDEDGVMATGTQTIDGKKYKFTKGGALII